MAAATTWTVHVYFPLAKDVTTTVNNWYTYCLSYNIITSECWRGPATRYSFLICTIHGSDFGRRKGIESCRCPINPDFTSNGSSRPFKAVFFNGRLWRSTVPRRTNNDKLREHSAFSSTVCDSFSWHKESPHKIIVLIVFDCQLMRFITANEAYSR